MTEFKDREQFIPLRRSDLIDLLCADPDLTPEDRELFRQLCRLVVATYHYEYNQILEKLKAAYAPFDPDADTKPLRRLRGEERQQRLNELVSEFGWLMERANFKHLSREEIEPTLAAASDIGLRM